MSEYFSDAKCLGVPNVLCVILQTMEQANLLADGILDDMLDDTVQELQRLQKFTFLASIPSSESINTLFCWCSGWRWMTRQKWPQVEYRTARLSRMSCRGCRILRYTSHIEPIALRDKKSLVMQVTV